MKPKYIVACLSQAGMHILARFCVHGHCWTNLTISFTLDTSPSTLDFNNDFSTMRDTFFRVEHILNSRANPVRDLNSVASLCISSSYEGLTRAACWYNGRSSEWFCLGLAWGKVARNLSTQRLYLLMPGFSETRIVLRHTVSYTSRKSSLPFIWLGVRVTFIHLDRGYISRNGWKLPKVEPSLMIFIHFVVRPLVDIRSWITSLQSIKHCFRKDKS